MLQCLCFPIYDSTCMFQYLCFYVYVSIFICPCLGFNICFSVLVYVSIFIFHCSCLIVYVYVWGGGLLAVVSALVAHWWNSPRSSQSESQSHRSHRLLFLMLSTEVKNKILPLSHEPPAWHMNWRILVDYNNYCTCMYNRVHTQPANPGIYWNFKNHYSRPW